METSKAFSIRERHFRRQGRFPMNQVRQRGAAHTQHLGGTGNRQMQLVQNLRLDEVALDAGASCQFCSGLSSDISDNPPHPDARFRCRRPQT